MANTKLITTNIELSTLLKEVKSASQATIAKVMGDAESLMQDVNHAMNEANKKRERLSWQRRRRFEKKDDGRHGQLQEVSSRHNLCDL